jgi:hypothetical protein
MGLPGLDLQQVGDNPAFTSGWYGSQRTPNLIGPAAQAYAQRLGGGFSPGSPGFSNIMSQLPMLMGQPGAMSGYGLPGYGF